MILCIKHIDIEGPGTMSSVVPDLRIVELYRGESLPEDLSGIDGVIALGGPMNVYEEEKCPFLPWEDRFLKSIFEAEIPVLGICLGSQLIAKATGAKVYRSPVTEIGFREVTLTAAGKRDPEVARQAKELLLNGIFPQDIRDQFMEMLEYFGQSPIIVRSSSLLEDAYGMPFPVSTRVSSARTRARPRSGWTV